MKVKQLRLSAVTRANLDYVRPLEAPQRFQSSSSALRLRGRARMTRNARLAKQRPLCAECERQGLVTAADEWDHIVPLCDGGPEHESNLQGLCKAHHDEKTAREAAERAQRRAAR
jgi:5-methylcytosine-specific restriction protein A